MSAKTEREYLGNGRYAVDQMLGAGGAGAVFLAYDTSLARWVAIKRIPATDSALFQEATVLASFQHPNIVTIFDVLQEGGEILIVMEFVEGQTLEELVEPMTEETFRDFAAQCLEGLGAAHEKNIVHRDIKPGNIMFATLATGGYRAKLLDFGQSRLMQAPSLQTIDTSGAVIGSVYMMSPEQLTHEELDPRTDFYSLGCVFYQALTLQRPFTGDNVAQVISAHLQHRFFPLTVLRPDLPRPLTAWVERLFSLDRNYRPASALEALRALKVAGGRGFGFQVLSTATKGIKVVAAPVLKPISVTNLPTAKIWTGESVVAPVSAPIPVTAATQPMPFIVAATPVADPIPGVVPAPSHTSFPVSVSVSPIEEPIPLVTPIEEPEPALEPFEEPQPVVAPIEESEYAVETTEEPALAATPIEEQKSMVAAIEKPEQNYTPDAEAASFQNEVTEPSPLDSEIPEPVPDAPSETRKSPVLIWLAAALAVIILGGVAAFVAFSGAKEPPKNQTVTKSSPNVQPTSASTGNPKSLSVDQKPELKIYDTDKNGWLSLEEFRGFWIKRFGQLDANRDGKLNPQEWNNGPFQTADTDRNGFVDLKEFLKVPPLIFEQPL